MDVEKLIKLVSKHEFLYDMTHSEYTNTGLKAITWDAISKELKQNVTYVKLKWKTIKDGYLRYKKLIKGPKKNSKKICDYVWKRQLMFLDNYTVTRRIKMLKQELHEEPSMDSSQPSPPSIERDFLHMQSDSHINSADDTCSNIDAASPTDSTNNTSDKQYRSNATDIDKLIHYLNDKEQDAVDHLFKSYAVSFKQLPCHQQAHIKIEMAKLFANAELGLVYDTELITETKIEIE